MTALLSPAGFSPATPTPPNLTKGIEPRHRYWIFPFLDGQTRRTTVAAAVRRSGTERAAYFVFDERKVGADLVRQFLAGELACLYIGRTRRLRKRMTQLVAGLSSGVARHKLTKLIRSGQIADCSPGHLVVLVVPTMSPVAFERCAFDSYVEQHGAYPVGNAKAPDRGAGNQPEPTDVFTLRALFPFRTFAQ